MHLFTSVKKPNCLSLSRYGLYSSPFDPVLFDLEMSGSSCKNIYNSSIGVQSDEIDLSDVLSGTHIDHMVQSASDIAGRASESMLYSSFAITSLHLHNLHCAVLSLNRRRGRHGHENKNECKVWLQKRREVAKPKIV